MIRVVHPTGNTFVRALLQALESGGHEYQYSTTMAFGKGKLSKMIPSRLRRQLERRSYEIPRERIDLHPWRELARLGCSGLGCRSLARHETGWASVDAVYQDLDYCVSRKILADFRRNAIQEPSWVYAYEDGALQSFQAAEEAGIKRAYELPIAYWETSRKLLEMEAQRWPEWAGTLVGTVDSPAKLQRKTQELELADVIVVPSQFVRRTLPDSLKETQRIVVAEFGSPAIEATAPDAEEIPRRRKSGKLRVLFAGSLSQRKGLADLFEAMRVLRRSDVELLLMGSPVESLAFYRAQNVPFTLEETRPHRQVLELMRSCDVLVLPSIVEGRALVQQEALACGLPLIITPNTGGEDLVREGETGFVVPIRAPQAIAEKIAWFADNRGNLESMRSSCADVARACTWERYAGIILESLGIIRKDTVSQASAH
ncbi:glycosyltransferase family 4 protein [Roseimicrobium sp. ORNL1]|uniref:glycosyltransferase family 4 protein n=1 Tax=Roseimicrobium sp. ORNL1 TaxID=2711231 RepID=UPI0013E0F4E8|nr:glycosyltransferase family 4 protein [Roseimicrobium sp. ORNL1]QIF02925.1 glycosyltransferase family 4 protein [Roseimicrobium sp. ORNL1]